MSRWRARLGKKGEQLAVEHLQTKGYSILGQNVRFASGEIDIVAVDGNTLVIVEVRTRSSDRYGTPAESITWQKQGKLRELALLYLKQQQRRQRIRFDIVCILYKDSATFELKHIIGAF
ncbi:YraN family protein [Brevibacillus sp. B_LB10_24]|uniref:YraN family protein n=1 Tax=Brevibacillus sp. B_LB10_24 TaxID=3380645 RepID=UPI0038BC9B7F